MRSLAELETVERAWQGRIAVSEPERFFDWQPYDPASFAALVEECLPYLAEPTFLEVGCGIGTKCLIAASYGLAVRGFDRVPEYVAQAQQTGVDAALADALDWEDYHAGLVYLNHPLACDAGCEDEALLEKHVQEAMSPGSVLLSVNYDLAPGCVLHWDAGLPCNERDQRAEVTGWREVLRRDGAWAAAWVKD